MKVGDIVTKEKVLNKKNPIGHVKKIFNEEIVVVWETINGDWYYVGDNRKLLHLVENEE